jgi:DNA invertase Pin-like site-specific DNA recombinase
MMSKITPDHLVRSAYVYIRQSTLDQVHRNHESRRRQYGLAERARQLGWGDVVVIDDDLAISGDGVKRPGFERLLVAICEERAGAVLTIEASRLARNGRDWHTLLEFCGLVNCLIMDEDDVYDPRLPNLTESHSRAWFLLMAVAIFARYGNGIGWRHACAGGAR